jgi:hypothetical protein
MVDPAIYHWGTYPQHLHQLDGLVSRTLGQSVNQLDYGLRWATAKPSWFDLWGS